MRRKGEGREWGLALAVDARKSRAAAERMDVIKTDGIMCGIQ